MGREKIVEGVITQGTAAVLGAAAGAVTKHAFVTKPGERAGPFVGQVTLAMGAAAATGAGVGGTVAAGAAVVTAKVAAVTAIATAAAPFALGVAIIGGVGWGLYKLFSDD